MKVIDFEQYDDVIAAINREKLLKEYKREWKLDLIESENPECMIYMKKLFHNFLLDPLDNPRDDTAIL